MTVRIPMKGATLRVTIGGTPTLIPTVLTIDDIVPRARTPIDVSAIDDAADYTVKGRMNYGSLTWTMMFDPSDTTHLALQSQCDGEPDTTLLVTLNNTAASTIQVVGPLLKVGTKGGDANSKYMASCELKINSITETP